MPLVAVGERTLRVEPLWARVDRNRVKLASFVGAFVVGSAALLTVALVVVPGVLLGWGAAQIELTDPASWFGRLPLVAAAAFLAMLALGGLAAAVQLANAEDWVRNRFKGRLLEKGESPHVESAVADMAIAAGLRQPPSVLVLDVDSVNAFALGASRKRPIIGVTNGFLRHLSPDEQRAVIATLTARIIAGDILFGTALAALMGPLKTLRESRKIATGCAGCATAGTGAATDRDAAAAVGEAAAEEEASRGAGSCLEGCGHGCSAADGCSDGCGCLDSLGDQNAGGCLGGIVVVVFIAVVIAITYVALLTAAWIVTLWGRVLQRTSYEKADAEGMLLLKDPEPMLSALRKAVTSSNEVGDEDPSYDGIFYAPTSGRPQVERGERRRFDRLREVLGVDGAEASLD